MKKFWPGPLSLVLPKNPNLPSVTTAGLDTVVVRYPKHKVAQAIIKASKTPIAAPSANISGRLSPTKADHAYRDLNTRVPMILDSGDIEYGLESTVVDCTSQTPTLLRPGSITLEMLAEVIPEISVTKAKTTKSPGMKYPHYATTAPITLFIGNPRNSAEALSKHLNNPNETAILWHSGDFSDLPYNLKLDANPIEAAPHLFNAMNELDQPNIKNILIQGYEDTGLGLAIMNRLEKAASKIIDV